MNTIKTMRLTCTLTACGAIALLAVQCRAPAASARDARPALAAAAAPSPAALAAWQVVYRVLEHPRCANCHPAGDVPLQGDDGHAHTQNVQRGSDGLGRYAMRCATCHQMQNLPGVHLPPGAPGWRLPHPSMPLVFVGKTPGDLCRQLKDPRHNGGRTPEQVLEHVTADPLVLWGWSPGDGRAPVTTPHAEFVQAMRTWIDNDCGCPKE